VTTAHDPWADLRAKHPAKKSRRKHVTPTGQEELPNLWTVVEAVTPVGALKSSVDDVELSITKLHQTTLW
jgi:hypothetical protein